MIAANLFQSLRRLTCFAAIADAGSIRGGATQLGLSVPVVSTALAELEQELGVILAVRSTRRMALTPAGEEVYQYAQLMLKSADDALGVATTKRKLKGKLALTIPVEMCAHWLPSRLIAFHKAYPDIDLHIDASDAVVPLRQSKYDLAIQAVFQNPGSEQTNVESLRKQSVALGELELVCVAAKKPRILKEESNTVFLNTPLVEIFGRGESLAAMKRSNHHHVAIRGEGLITINNHGSALALVKAGLGAMLVMVNSVTTDLAEKRLVKVMPSYDFGHLNIEVKLRDTLPSPETKVFVEFIANSVDG